MKVLSLADLKPHEVVAAPLTKKEKLTRFAALVDSPNKVLRLFHNLEYQSMHDKNRMNVTGSAFGVAVNDPAFRADGIGVSVGDAQRYFELTDQELHEFSCDCGGPITNQDQAARIRQIADKA